MRVELIAADDPAWDDWLRDVPHDIYHTAGYHAYARGSGEGVPFLLVVGDRRRGIAWPYLRRRVDEVEGLAGSDATDVHSVYGYPGPVAWGCRSGDPFLAQAWSEIWATWRQQGAVAAFTRFNPLLDNVTLLAGIPSPGGAGEGAGRLTALGPTISFDLTIDREAVRAAYGRDLRREIDQGRRAGLATTVDEDWTDITSFTRLYHETMVRAGATSYYFFDESDFRRLRAALPGCLDLLVTRHGGKVAAAGLFTEYHGVVQWYLAGSSEEFQALSPSKVLAEDASDWARARGNTVLHLGGGRGGRQDSLLWFKSRFSPRRHLFHVGTWILDRAAYGDLVAAHMEIVGDRGDPDTSFFPAYRAPGRRGPAVTTVTKPAGPTSDMGTGRGTREAPDPTGAGPTAELLDASSPRWSAFLGEARHDFYHLPSYTALCAAQEGGEPRAILVERGQRRMLLPIIIRPIPGGRHDAVSPYGYPGPLFSGPDEPGFLVEALHAGLDMLRDAGVVAVFVRLHPLLNTSPLPGVGTVVQHGETVSIDLTLSDEAQWGQMRANHRRDIRRALSLGYVARMDETWQRWAAFKRLYQATMERHRAAPFYFFDDTYFDGLRDALGDRLHLCVVERGDTVAAAGLFAETCGIVQYHLSGFDWPFAQVRPTKLLIHGACGWGKEKGDLRLHLGGGVAGARDSLFHFKAGFSSLRHPFRTLRVVLDEAEYGRLVSARDPSLDPSMQGGFFPPYRKR